MFVKLTSVLTICGAEEAEASVCSQICLVMSCSRFPRVSALARMASPSFESTKPLMETHASGSSEHFEWTLSSKTKGPGEKGAPRNHPEISSQKLADLECRFPMTPMEGTEPILALFRRRISGKYSATAETLVHVKGVVRQYILLRRVITLEGSQGCFREGAKKGSQKVSCNGFWRGKRSEKGSRGGSKKGLSRSRNTLFFSESTTLTLRVHPVF